MTVLLQSRSDDGVATGEAGPACASRPLEAAVSELVARVGVNVGSIQGWEAGGNYPGLASLKALVAAGLRADGFTAGREREEAAELGPPRGEHGPVLKRVTQRSV